MEVGRPDYRFAQDQAGGLILSITDFKSRVEISGLAGSTRGLSFGGEGFCGSLAKISG
jgi:hypothetical protein